MGNMMNAHRVRVTNPDKRKAFRRCVDGKILLKLVLNRV
jgi:hypothetical protein